jgi:hypothetical protein
LTTSPNFGTNLLPAERPPARRHHFGTPGDIISESAGDFVGICRHPLYEPQHPAIRPDNQGNRATARNPVWVENRRLQRTQHREVRVPLFSIFKRAMLGNTLSWW